MKKVLIIGANGKVGRIISEKMQDSADFNPVALIRDEDQREFFEKINVESKIGDLEGDVNSLVQQMAGFDAIVFTAGSGGKTGFDKTLAVDLDGAVKAMEAALKAKVKRFVMVSALYADRRDAWDSRGIKPYYVAKHYADRMLKSIGLDYTIVRPGRLLDEPGKGKITTTEPESERGVAREDVATLILEVLQHENTVGQVIEFNEGDMPIRELVKGL